MANTPSPWLIPYPIGTDRVTDGDNAMQALAERVALLLNTVSGNIAGFSPNVTNLPVSINYAIYAVTGRVVNVWCVWNITGATQGAWSTPLPIAARSGIASGLQVVGQCRIIRQGTGLFTGRMALSSSTSVTFTADSGAGWGTAGVPVAPAAGDSIGCSYSYPLDNL